MFQRVLVLSVVLLFCSGFFAEGGCGACNSSPPSQPQSACGEACAGGTHRDLRTRTCVGGELILDTNLESAPAANTKHPKAKFTFVRATAVLDGHRDATEAAALSNARAQAVIEFFINQRSLDTGLFKKRDFGAQCDAVVDIVSLNPRVNVLKLAEGETAANPAKSCGAPTVAVPLNEQSHHPCNRSTTRITPLLRARLAQLDRALVSEAEGRWFDSSIARHSTTLDSLKDSSAICATPNVNLALRCKYVANDFFPTRFLAPLPGPVSPSTSR